MISRNFLSIFSSNVKINFTKYFSSKYRNKIEQNSVIWRKFCFKITTNIRAREWFNFVDFTKFFQCPSVFKRIRQFHEFFSLWTNENECGRKLRFRCERDKNCFQFKTLLFHGISWMTCSAFIIFLQWILYIDEILPLGNRGTFKVELKQNIDRITNSIYKIDSEAEVLASVKNLSFLLVFLHVCLETQNWEIFWNQNMHRTKDDLRLC